MIDNMVQIMKDDMINWMKDNIFQLHKMIIIDLSLTF